MNNPTDTNQASEDEVAFIVNEYRDINRNEFTQVTANCKCGRGGWVRLDKYPDVQSAIRTEKLKLLAEVSERVVGENDYQPGNPAPGLVEHNQLVRDGLRFEQRVELNKLEAEL